MPDLTDREKALIALLRDVEKTLRVNPFVMVNMANLIESKLTEIVGDAGPSDK